MTRDEIKNLLATMQIYFSSFKIEDKLTTLNAYEVALGDIPEKLVVASLKHYLFTSGSAFAPTIPQIIEGVRRIAGANEAPKTTESEAWAMVRKAIGRSIYYSQEEFDKLPEDVRRAVGSASQLRVWASDENFNEGVESSNFKRIYREVAKETEERQVLIGMASTLGIGVNDEG